MPSGIFFESAFAVKISLHWESLFGLYEIQEHFSARQVDTSLQVPYFNIYSLNISVVVLRSKHDFLVLYAWLAESVVSKWSWT